jgi:plasmid stabilization system protein ParE
LSDPARYAVLFDPEALRDLEEIADYMAEVRGRDDADALIQAIRAHIDALHTFPRRGSTL